MLFSKSGLFSFLFLTVGLIIFLPLPTYAEGFNHGDACTTAGAFHQKNETWGADFLICNGSNWKSAVFFNSSGNNVRVDDNPAAGSAGCIRYSGANSKIQFSHDCLAYSDFGGGGAGPSGTLSVAFTTTRNGTTSGSSINFSASSIGTASPDRYVVAAVTAAVDSTISSVTIGGQPATQAVFYANTSAAPDNISGIYYAAVPSGTTADIVVTLASGNGFVGATVFSVTGTNHSLTVETTGTDDAADPMTLPADAGEASIYVFLRETGTTMTWTNATEVSDFDHNGDRHSAAYRAHANAESVGVDPSPTGSNHAYVGALFKGGVGAPPGGSDRQIQFNSGGTLAAAPTFVYTSAGNMGLGTSSPQGPLHVQHNFPWLLSFDSGLAFSSANPAWGMRAHQDGKFVIQPTDDYTTYDDRFTFYSAGHLYIKTPLGEGTFLTLEGQDYEMMKITTHEPATNHTYPKVHFRGSNNIGGAAGVGVRIEAQSNDVYSNGNAVMQFTVRNSSGAIANSNLFDWSNDNTAVMTMNSAGQLGIGDNTPDVALDVVGDINYTGVIADVSDRRHKENITPLANSLDGILALQGYSFTMKGDESGQVEYGLMAQEVQPVFPELVLSGDDGFMKLNYMGLFAPLVEAVKQQHSLIEAQNTKIDALSAQNAALEARLRALEGHFPGIGKQEEPAGEHR